MTPTPEAFSAVVAYVTQELSRLERQDDHRRLLKAAAQVQLAGSDAYVPSPALRSLLPGVIADLALRLGTPKDGWEVFARGTADLVDDALSEQARACLDEAWSLGAPDFVARLQVACAGRGLPFSQ